jgi:CubicO group peptidase (beta-lactamase class C family)
MPSAVSRQWSVVGGQRRTTDDRRLTADSFFIVIVTAIVLAGCVPARPPTVVYRPVPTPPPAMPVRPVATDVLLPALPTAAGMAASLSRAVDSVVRAGIAAGAAPGAAVAVGRYGRLVLSRGYGRTSGSADAQAVTDSTLWDLASLTKVVATTTVAMMLEEQGKLNLDRTVVSYIPELTDPGKAVITIRMLLTHSGGMEAFAPLYLTTHGREEYLRAINERPLEYAPGTRTVYSDWDMILLQLVLERITGQPLDELVQRLVFRPLGMRDTGFRPDRALLPRIAPTEMDRQRGLIHGDVHDPNAWAMGGVAGHAGLFSSARDLAIFAQMLLNGGSYAGVRLLAPRTVARWTAPQGPGSSRAIGWDTPSGQSSAGRYFSPRSFGHTGFTGTSLWIDPERGLFVVLLTNRVNYTSDNQLHVPLRRAVADAVQQAIVDAPLLDWEGVR